MEQTVTTSPSRRVVRGTLAALATTLVLTLVMVPLRDHLGVATAALVLVVPVVVGVATGGFAAGVVSVGIGFCVYDLFFIPPYWTLKVGATENWVALAVYVAVMIPIARLVARTITARTEAQSRGEQLQRLLDLSALLIEDRPVDVLLATIVTTLRDLYDARQVALLLPRDGGLEIAASAGEPLTDEDRASIRPKLGRLSRLDTPNAPLGGPVGFALVAAGRPVGLLAITAASVDSDRRESLHLFANQAALAIERAQLREQALRADLTAEVERLASTLIAAVSHDLRSPLASIKAASSILVDPDLTAEIDQQGRSDLAVLIDAQVDRLAGLVTNLLDMGRIQAGVLQPRTDAAVVRALVDAAIDSLPVGQLTPPPRLVLDEDLPLVDVDALLVTRVLANLLDNAYRHTPTGTGVVVGARRTGETVTISVTDHGRGISPDRRGEIFGLYIRRSNDHGTGLGLAIAKTYVDAHQQRIWVDAAPDGGASFHFTVAVAEPSAPSMAPGSQGRIDGVDAPVAAASKPTRSPEV